MDELDYQSRQEERVIIKAMTNLFTYGRITKRDHQALKDLVLLDSSPVGFTYKKVNYTFSVTVENNVIFWINRLPRPGISTVMMILFENKKRGKHPRVVLGTAGSLKIIDCKDDPIARKLTKLIKESGYFKYIDKVLIKYEKGTQKCSNPVLKRC